MSKIKEVLFIIFMIILTTIIMFIPTGIGYYYRTASQTFIGIAALSVCMFWYVYNQNKK